MHAWQTLRGFIVLLAWLVAHTAGAAELNALQIDTANRYGLSTAFTYLEDRSAELSLQDILEPHHQAQFVPVTREGTNFGSTNSAIWLRVQLQLSAIAPAQWLLTLQNRTKTASSPSARTHCGR